MNTMTAARVEQLKPALKELIVEECDKDIAPKTIDADALVIGGPLDLDSLDALQILLAVQKRYGVRIQSGPDARHALTSITCLAETIARRESAQG